MKKFELLPVKVFKKTICDTGLESLGDIAEIGLDSFLEEGFTKDFPVFGFLFRTGNIISSMRDAITAKKIVIFAQKVQRNSISDDALQKHIEQLKHNSNKFESELETILDYIDKQTGCLKSEILANFYYSFLKREIDWDNFILFADITSDINTPDIETLIDLFQKREYFIDYPFDPYCAKRLDKCSLIDYFNGMVVTSKGKCNKQIVARINNLGDEFVKIGLENISGFSIGGNGTFV